MVSKAAQAAQRRHYAGLGTKKNVGNVRLSCTAEVTDFGTSSVSLLHDMPDGTRSKEYYPRNYLRFQEHGDTPTNANDALPDQDIDEQLRESLMHRRIIVWIPRWLIDSRGRMDCMHPRAVIQDDNETEE